MAIANDDFERANSATVLNPPSDGGPNWIGSAGAVGIDGGAAYCSDGASPAYRLRDIGTGDVVIETVLSAYGQYCGVRFRETDANNNLQVQLSNEDPKVRLWRVVAGTYTSLDDYNPVTISAPIKVVVDCEDANINVYFDDVLVMSAVEEFNKTAGKHGFQTFGTVIPRFSYFNMTYAGPPAPVLSSPTAGTPGTTTITIGATSDRASDGTMRFLRRVGGSAASAATIASTGESQAATANPQSRAMTGFTAGSANNYVDMVQVGAGGNSNVVSAGPFTMASAAATAVTLSGPSGGVNGAASTNFTVGANGAITGSLVVTPSAGGGGGTFSPASVTLTSGSPTATFTYTPASTGAKTISVTNGGGLTNPSAITYTVTAAQATALTATIAAAAGLTGIRGVVLSSAAPGPGSTVIYAFNDESFDGSGNISIPIAGLGVPQGQYRWVELTQSNGDPAQSPAPFGAHGPMLAS